MGTEPLPEPTTPRPRMPVRHSTNTPFKKKQMSQAHISDYQLEESRSAVVKDTGPTIPEVPYDYLRNSVLPRLHSKTSVDKVVADLKTAGQIDSSNRWKVFPKDPATLEPKYTETIIFNRLIDIIAAIAEHSGVESSEQTVEYSSSPNQTPICDYIDKANQPDGYMVMKDKLKTAPKGRQYWRDICAPAEFKKQDRDVDLRDVRAICGTHE